MSNHVLKELPELVSAGVITEQTSDDIKRYYDAKPNPSANRLFVVFAVLGAILTGLGIILIIAHNWDEMHNGLKLFFALLPLLVGQAACAFALIKKPDSDAWREASSAFLVFAVAASISIVSQVYHIQGNLGRFLMVWMILTLPVIYVMRSSLTSLLYIAGITWYACEVVYFHYPFKISWYYWLMLLAEIPYYIYLYREKSHSNFFYFHSWLLAISISITVGMFTEQLDEVTVLLYMNVFAAFIAIGQLKKISDGRLISNGFLVGGSLGTIVLLLVLTFDFYWDEVVRTGWIGIPVNSESLPYWITFVIALGFLIRAGMQRSFAALNAKSYAFIAILVLFFVSGTQPDIARIVTNILLFAFGVFTIRDGAKQDRLSLLNYGLMIITALIICRFFDIDMSFVARGLLFILVGVGFFAANYWLIRKRKNSAS